MRAYVGALLHETNAFSPVPTSLAGYQEAGLGFRELMDAASEAGLDIVRGLSLRAAPSAPTARGDYETLRGRLVADIAAQDALDLVLLALHGAQVAEGYADCEGDILRSIRDAVGGAVVVGVLLDLHASISDAMLENADLLVSIKEYPHTDYPPSARQLVTLAAACHRGDIAPVTAFVPLPLYTLWHTPRPPSRDVVARARQLEAAGDVLHISLVHGFPWSDVPGAGAAVLVICDGDDERACRVARDFAGELWAIRDADLAHYRCVDDCIAEASASAAGPVVIADAADNPGAGCGGDATWLLHALLDSEVERAALGVLVDRAAVEAAFNAGTGATLRLALGGYTGPLAGRPVAGEYEVAFLCEAATVDAMPGSPPIDGVRLARLKTGAVDIVVSDLREQVFGPRVFTEVGLEPAQYRVLVVKSAQHFYAAFESIASRILYADSPCSRSIDFRTLPFRNRRHPMWPLEPLTAADIPPPRVFSGAGSPGQ